MTEKDTPRTLAETLAHENAQMLDSYFAGIQMEQLLNEYQITYNEFFDILNTLGLEPRKVETNVAGARKTRMDHAIQLYQDGALIRTIVSESGIAQPRLHTELHRRGISLRTKGTK